MGCTDSKKENNGAEAAQPTDAAKTDETGGPDVGGSNAKAVDKYVDVPTSELISEDDKHKIRETWEQFREANSESETGYGHIIFFQLFKLSPSSRFLFNFVSSVTEEDLVHNHKLRWHIGRVVDAITGAVFVLDDIKGVMVLLEKLGGRHNDYGVKGEFFPALKTGVLYALERGLGNDFTAEKRESFDKFVTFVARCMMKGLQEVSSGQKISVAL